MFIDSLKYIYIYIKKKQLNILFYYSPLNGTAAETEFDFVCNGWVTEKEDRPLTYEFQYDLLDDRSNQPNRATILNPTTPERPYLLNTKLPAGRKTDFTMRIKVKIINRFGAYETFETQRITVRDLFIIFLFKQNYFLENN